LGSLLFDPTAGTPLDLTQTPQPTTGVAGPKVFSQISNAPFCFGPPPVFLFFRVNFPPPVGFVPHLTRTVAFLQKNPPHLFFNLWRFLLAPGGGVFLFGEAFFPVFQGQFNFQTQKKKKMGFLGGFPFSLCWVRFPPPLFGGTVLLFVVKKTPQPASRGGFFSGSSIYFFFLFSSSPFPFWCGWVGGGEYVFISEFLL